MRQSRHVSGEFCLDRSDGTNVWVLLNINLVEGDIALGYCQDITERKQAERKIQSALEEKETLLSEVHHRVKNNLQTMIALMKMQSGMTKDKSTQQFLKELEGQTHAMSLVYEQLYQSENLAHVKMQPYIEKLISNVLEAFNPKAKTGDQYRRRRHLIGCYTRHALWFNRERTFHEYSETCLSTGIYKKTFRQNLFPAERRCLSFNRQR